MGFMVHGWGKGRGWANKRDTNMITDYSEMGMDISVQPVNCRLDPD